MVIWDEPCGSTQYSDLMDLGEVQDFLLEEVGCKAGPEEAVNASLVKLLRGGGLGGLDQGHSSCRCRDLGTSQGVVEIFFLSEIFARARTSDCFRF